MPEKKYTFYFDASRCSGCKTCQVACKDKNNLAAGIRWRRIYEAAGGGWKKKGGAWINDVKAYNVSIACNHCEKPICVDICPTRAMHTTRNGIVRVDEDKCIGCKYCLWACPYGAPQYDEYKGVMGKCDFCFDYLEEGRNPSCVDSCPMRALDFGELSEMKRKYGDKNEVFPLPEAKHTQPALIITPHKDAFGAKDSSAGVQNKEEV
jgi:anaerobic dimethyl sulfoxide reductase subunit B (iron-sulfur subunit)